MVMVEVNTIITRQLAQWISREIFIDAGADEGAGRQAGRRRQLIILVVVGKIKQTLDSDWNLDYWLLLLMDWTAVHDFFIAIVSCIDKAKQCIAQSATLHRPPKKCTKQRNTPTRSVMRAKISLFKKVGEPQPESSRTTPSREGGRLQQAAAAWSNQSNT